MAISRRYFLQTAIAAATATAIPLLNGCRSSSNSRANDKETHQRYFPQSVMSGDPRPSSVILWTRVNDESMLQAGTDIELRLQVSTDSTFTTAVVNSVFTASAAHDHTVKVRVTELQPYTHYYYRFVYVKDGEEFVTNIGRTKTAPTESDDREIKFAYASCQDYIGRYYNTYLRLLEQDMLDSIDFIVHLGDYIYETTGDESFQNTTPERAIAFSDTEGALSISTGTSQFYAAQSVSNYRDLYKTYRTDSVLQKMQESFPFISTWDDHEFSDDSWQANSTYLDGAASEENIVRKKNSEQAFFEYMPIDHESVAGESSTAQDSLSISDEQLFPNTKIYRDFKFGQHVHLVMSDFRTYRPDHLIPEDAFPGSIAMSEAELKQTLGEQFEVYKASMSRYMSGTDLIEYLNAVSQELAPTLQGGLAQQYQKEALQAGATLSTEAANAKVANIFAGNIDIDFLQAFIIDPIFNADKTESERLVISNPEKEKVGLSFYLMGKTTFIGNLGARYFVVKDTFDLYAQFKAATQPSTANYYGDAQNQWLATQLNDQAGTWKVLGSSVSYSPLVLDLRAKERGRAALPAAYAALDSQLDLVPSPFNQRFYLNVDHWDGAVAGKQQIIGLLAQRKNVVSIGGDIHSHYASKLANGVFDLTSSSVSSGTFGSYLDGGLDSLLEKASFSAAQLQLVQGLKNYYDVLITAASSAPDAPQVKVAKTREHGVAVATANSQQMTVKFYNLPTEGLQGQNYVTENLYEKSYSVDFAEDVKVHTYVMEKDQDELQVMA